MNKLFFRIINIGLVALIVLASGCGQGEAENKYVAKEGFNVSLSYYEGNDTIFVKDGALMHNIALLVTNNENFSLNCSLFYSFQNSTGLKKWNGEIGVIRASKQKLATINADFFEGESAIFFDLDCRKI